MEIIAHVLATCVNVELLEIKIHIHTTREPKSDLERKPNLSLHCDQY